MTAIIVIAKSPVPGRVKTRLCPPCSPDEAAALARAALADTLETVARTEASAHVLALDGPPGPWIPDGFVIVPQLGQGLGERLANAFAAVTGAAVLVGMDTPQLSPAHLTSVVRALHTPGVDAVLGRASDGGWWTLGLHRADARVFVDVPMSTPETGRAQLARLQALGWHTVVVDEMRDVDTYADALAVADLIPASRFAAALRAMNNAGQAVG
jgi:rSAM/selenodomain-associated transferase 1